MGTDVVPGTTSSVASSSIASAWTLVAAFLEPLELGDGRGWEGSRNDRRDGDDGRGKGSSTARMEKVMALL